jgi:chromosomal replication initiation ATPase DnaA
MHEVIRAGEKRGNTARQVALYLSHRQTGLGNETIGKYFGIMPPSSVSKASARVKDEMLKDKRQSTLVHDIASIVKA